MNKKGFMMLAVVLAGSLSGCASNNVTLHSDVDDTAVETAHTSDEETKVEVELHEIVEPEVASTHKTEADFLTFFENYFGFDEEALLAINQLPPKSNAAYEEMRLVYQKEMIRQIGEYLSDDVMQQFEQNYLDKTIEPPKKLAINEYVTYGKALVESVEILSYHPKGENTVYEVAVITENTVKDSQSANKEYAWDDRVGYYVAKSKVVNPKPAFDTLEPIFSEIANSYLLTKDYKKNPLDTLKLRQTFWVEVKPTQALQVSAVTSAQKVVFEADTKQKAENVGHVERLPYYSELQPYELEIIQETIEALFKQPRAYYEALEKSYATSFDAFDKTLAVLELEAYMKPTKNTYKQLLTASISPYKDNMMTLQRIEEDFTVIILPETTAKQGRYQVNVPVRVILSDQTTKDYEHSYYIAMEQGEIEHLRFLNARELSR